jgi:hypothetical protein
VGKSGTGIFNQLGLLSYLETNHLKIGQFLSSSGTYNLSDGTLVAHDVEINSGGTVNQTGGSLTFGALNNTGNVNLTGGTAEVGPTTNQAGGRLNISNEASFVGYHVNYGTIKTTGATVTWGGTFTNNGTYISDPSKQTFGNLVVGPEGCIMGYSQDLFVVTGNLEVHSTQNDKWQTDQATLQFITMAIDTDTEQTNVHAFYIPGADLGPGGGAHNFRWGTLMIEEVTVHLLDGNQNNQGSALYVGHIEGLEVNENTQTIMNIYGFEGLHLYYDPFLNPDLQGMTYSLMGLNNQDGGHLAPTPVPASALLLGSGLMGLGLLGWRRKRR